MKPASEGEGSGGVLGLDNVRLYQILRLPRTDASPEDIKKAYRKMAARTHPDRNLNDPDSTGKFQQVQYAYSVLSDPKLRGIYDSYGEHGLKIYEQYVNYATGGDSNDVNQPPLSPALMISAFCGTIGFFVVLSTALCINLNLKLDGSSNASLSLLFIPLWILDSVALIVISAYILMIARRAQALDLRQLLTFLSALAYLLTFIAFQILLVVRTDELAPSLPYALVFAPVFVEEAISTAWAANRLRPSVYEAEVQGGTASSPMAMHALLTLGWPLSRIATTVLIVTNLDHATGLDWWLVAAPVLGYLLLYILFGCQQSRAQPKDEREQLIVAGHRFALICAVLFTLLLIRAITIVRHSNTDHAWLSFFIVFYIFAGCFCCCCSCCVLAFSRGLPSGTPVEVPPGDGMSEPLQSSDRSSASGASQRSSTSPPTPPATEDAPLLSSRKGPDRV